MIGLRRFLSLSICATAISLAEVHAQNSDAERALAGADILLDTVRPVAASKVRFSGATSFTDEELRAAIGEQIREIDTHGATPARADDAAYFVGAFYRKAGFSRVETTYTLTGDKALIQIDEGPRSLLRSLTFIGNQSFPTPQLYDYMLGATPERLAREPDLFPFNQSAIAAGADRVRGFYVSEGYLDVLVDASQADLSADGRGASVTVQIKENTRYTFGEVRFAGDLILPRETVLAGIGEPLDGPYSRTKAISMQRNLESFYRGKGYFLAAVELTSDPKLAVRGRVPVLFTVKPGALHRFDGAKLKNLTQARVRLHDSFLPKRFRHLHGDVYDPERVDEVYRELLRSGLFSNLRLNATALPDHTVRLDFTLEEAKAREVGVTLGYGTYDGYKIGLRLADKNLLGYGRPLTFAADYSQRGLDAELAYVDPWFLDHPKLNLRAKLFSADRMEEGYTKEETGARIDLGWKALPHLELGAFAHQAQVSVTEFTIDPLLLGPLDYQLVSIGVKQTTDFTDNLLAPTRGWIFTTALDLATVDGEQSFSRTVARLSWYMPIGKCQLALGGRMGMIQPIADQIPIDARFFNGGATTVRSFTERNLGPKDEQGNPLGGEFYSVFNAELTFPIAGALQAAVFVDAGNLLGRDQSGVTDLRYAVGIGLRYALPVGPLRLDYGVNPDRREDEDFGAFHFSFGVAF